MVEITPWWYDGPNTENRIEKRASQLKRVRIAWFSRRAYWRYHICSDCQYNQSILLRNIEFGVEDEVEKTLIAENPKAPLNTEFMCEDCRDCVERNHQTWIVVRLA